jgi:signal transduction histidine kinase
VYISWLDANQKFSFSHGNGKITVTCLFTQATEMRNAAFIFIILIPLYANAQQPRAIDSLKNLIAGAKSDSSKVNLLDDLCWEYLYYDPQKSIPYALEAIALARDVGFVKGEGRLLNTLGAAYSNLGNFDKALANYKMALLIKEKINDLSGKASSLVNIGNTFQFKGYYDSANTYYMRGLPILEKLKNPGNLADTYNNVSAMHEYQENFDEMSTYANKGLAVSLDAGYDPGIMNAKILIGNANKHRGHDAEALIDYQGALKIATHINDVFGMTTCYHNIGGLYLKDAKTTEALLYYRKQLAFATTLNSPNDSLYALMGIGQAQIKETNFGAGRLSLYKALDLSTRLGTRNETKQIYESLSLLFEQMGDYPKSLRYHKLFTSLNDSLFSERKSKQINELGIRFETTKKENEIEALNRNNALQSLQISRERLIRNFSIGGLVLFFFVAILLYINARQRMSANRLLTAQKQQVEEANAVRTKLFSIISHDLRTPISSLQGLLQIIEEKKIAGMAPLTDHARSVTDGATNLIDNLLYWAASQSNGIIMRFGAVDLHELADEAGKLLLPLLASKKIVYCNLLEPGERAYADSASVRLVLRNLLSNAVKFTPEGGKITISATNIGAELEIAITDTGIGILPVDRIKLFTYEKASTRGTGNESGAGLGLVLCREFVERNGGRIWVDDPPEGGSIFKFTLQAQEFSVAPNRFTSLRSTTEA